MGLGLSGETRPMKPKAPEWLRLSFAEGVDERTREANFGGFPAYDGARGNCYLARHDPLHRPCSGRLERFHYVNRQRIENAMAALLLAARWEEFADGPEDSPFSNLILLAAWDPRVGGISCEGHHRRFDSALTPPLVVPYDALPSHVTEWAESWGLESQLEARCPRPEVVS